MKKVLIKITQIHRNTTALEPRFNKVACLKFAKFLRIPILKNIYKRLVLLFQKLEPQAFCKKVFLKISKIYREIPEPESL